jgi:hypothetical protein
MLTSTPIARPPATVATGCSLAKAVNLSLASMAFSPARSIIVRSLRASLRLSAAATFFLICLRFASAMLRLRK